MTKAQLRYDYWPPVLYPLVMAACVGLFFILRGIEQPLLLYTYVPVILGAAIITLAELHLPHLKLWIANRHDVLNDTLFMVVVQMFLLETLTVQ